MASYSVANASGPEGLGHPRSVRRQPPDGTEAAIVANPSAAPVIQGMGGLRKLRWAGSGRGKRGGIRTIYFRRADPDAIYLLSAYAKADRENLSPATEESSRSLLPRSRGGIRPFTLWHDRRSSCSRSRVVRVDDSIDDRLSEHLRRPTAFERPNQPLVVPADPRIFG